jgi:hypothetical protein
LIGTARLAAARSKPQPGELAAGPETPIEDLMKPERWPHCARLLHMG